MRAHAVEQWARVAQLDVHRAGVGAGLREVVEEITRVVDHQVAVEVQVGTRSKARNDGRADREVRHEVAVHDIDVQQVSLGRDARDVVGECGEVGRED